MELFNLVIFAIVFSTALVVFMVFGLLVIANIMMSQKFMRKYSENIVEAVHVMNDSNVKKEEA